MSEFSPFLQLGAFGAFCALVYFAARWFAKRDEKEQETRAEERKVQQEQIAKDRQFLHELVKAEREHQARQFEALQQVTESTVAHINRSNAVLAELQLSLVNHRHEFQVHAKETQEGYQRLQPVGKGT